MPDAHRACTFSVPARCKFGDPQKLGAGIEGAGFGCRDWRARIPVDAFADASTSMVTVDRAEPDVPPVAYRRLELLESRPSLFTTV